jgi:hypothetical protein
MNLNSKNDVWGMLHNLGHIAGHMTEGLDDNSMIPDTIKMNIYRRPSSANAPRSRSVGYDMFSPLAHAVSEKARADHSKMMMERVMSKARMMGMGMERSSVNVGGNLLHRNPALQSQPYSENFQFKNQLPPAYAKVKRRGMNYAGRGLYA